MEDVVLHHQPGSTNDLRSLLETTEKLLEPFPCRTPPVFAPWFSSLQLPLRPAKSAPVISTWGDSLVSNSKRRVHAAASPPGNQPTPPSPPEKRRRGGVPCVPETQSLLPEGRVTTPEPRGDKDGVTVSASPTGRCWSICPQRGDALQSRQSMSKHFRHVVSVHQLHLRQRVRWVIGEHNCGAARDMEQLWQTLSRGIGSARLPTCNATIHRDRAEVWVFCDVLCSEQVGRVLMDELRLSGSIVLWVPRLGHVFSM